MSDNFLLDNLMKSRIKSKCNDKIPALSRLHKSPLTDYIDKNVISLVKDYTYNLIRIRIGWRNKMFDEMSLEDCWKYAFELMNNIFEFRKIREKIFISCSFSTYTGKANNTYGINYGMPILYIFIIHQYDVFKMSYELINFITSNPKFEPIYTLPENAVDPCNSFKNIFHGHRNSYLTKMIPDGYVVHWYSSIEKFNSFMHSIKKESKSNRMFGLNCKEIKFQ
jgi:hypothetical protein